MHTFVFQTKNSQLYLHLPLSVKKCTFKTSIVWYIYQCNRCKIPALPPLYLFVHFSLSLCALVSHLYNEDPEHTYFMRLKDSTHIKHLQWCLINRKTYRLSTITIIIIIITNFVAVINATIHVFSALCFLAPLQLGGAIWRVLANELWEVTTARSRSSELFYSGMGASYMWNDGYSNSLQRRLLDPQWTNSISKK